jgi:hypothetical protein
MDEKQLGEEKVSTLIKCAPTTEELDQVNDFSGDVNDLGPTEKFFRTIGVIKDVAVHSHAHTRIQPLFSSCHLPLAFDLYSPHHISLSHRNG